MAREEHPIGIKDPVWINHQLVEHGTYNRYSTDGRRVVLGRLDRQNETYDLDVSSIYLQHKLGRFYNDTASSLPVLISVAWSVNSPAFYLDGICRDFYPHTLLNKKSTPVWITVEDLRRVGSKGFCLENCGIEDVCSTDDLVGIYKDQQNNRITIYRVTNGQLQCSSYRLSKITRAKVLS